MAVLPQNFLTEGFDIYLKTLQHLSAVILSCGAPKADQELKDWMLHFGPPAPHAHTQTHTHSSPLGG